MRDLIACLYASLTLPPRRPVRTIRAARTIRTHYQQARSQLLPPTPAPPVQVIPPAPAYARRPRPRGGLLHLAEQSLALRNPSLCRPYSPAYQRPRVPQRHPCHLVYERARAAAGRQRLQRERRTAAALATVGIDYGPAFAALA
ncbi:hypothetical protein ACWDBW_30170 [Streptomyces sp. NPDC001107]